MAVQAVPLWWFYLFASISFALDWSVHPFLFLWGFCGFQQWSRTPLRLTSFQSFLGVLLASCQLSMLTSLTSVPLNGYHVLPQLF